MAKEKKEKELEDMDMDEYAEARNGKSYQELESMRIERAENGYVLEVCRRPTKKAKKNTGLEAYKPPARSVFETVEALMAEIKKELED